MGGLGEVHRAKTEYLEARKINELIFHKYSSGQDPFDHAVALLNLTELDIHLGASGEQVGRNIERIKSMFAKIGYKRGQTLGDLVSGDLQLREANFPIAEKLLRKCVQASQGKDGEILVSALGMLANSERWNFLPSLDNWSIVFLVHVLKSREQLEIHRALQFLGEGFLHRHESETAKNLFIVALERFAQMDIHQNRAECMLHLGDISCRGGDWLQAVELWTAARPLFERCSQIKEVAKLDARLAGIKQEEQERCERTLSAINVSTAVAETRDAGSLAAS
ncbi:hypothetical protein C8F04DRAFT_1266013 [Mycena alexandri]|uniref:Uncharacterized protein n=1 Tax=Mycena alexandri TaxID=1745969 RepID=A0AAD6WYP2_9AGAR|nr:hypothetical protein C8F04DRAFT_1266013 [Mycena alexandri]